MLPLHGTNSCGLRIARRKDCLAADVCAAIKGIAGIRIESEYLAWVGWWAGWAVESRHKNSTREKAQIQELETYIIGMLFH